jgi:hypothetical protein
MARLDFAQITKSNCCSHSNPAQHGLNAMRFVVLMPKDGPDDHGGERLHLPHLVHD